MGLDLAPAPNLTVRLAIPTVVGRLLEDVITLADTDVVR